MFLFIVILIIVSIYLICQKRHQYWKERNLPSPKPTFLFGHSLRYLLKKENYHLCLKSIYDSAPGHRYVGGFEGLNPVLVVRDPTAVLDITVKDHLYFNGRYIPWFIRMYDTENINPLSDNIFSNQGNRWKILRQRVTHTFSSSKSRKNLLNHSLICTRHFNTVFNQSKRVDFQDICLKYIIDIVGLWVFGIECNTLLGDSSSMVETALTAFDNNNTFRYIIYAIQPKLLDLLKIPDFSKKNSQFFVNLVRDIIAYREKHNIREEDLLDTLIDLVGESSSEMDPEARYTEVAIFGNIFSALVASYENTGLTLFYALYEMTVNIDIQDKLRDEITSVMKQRDGKVDLDMLNELKYLDMILAETTRKYPIDGALFRKCTKDYVIPETSTSVETGTIVLIPTYGFHHDPKLFPNPQKFDPGRFSHENKRAIPKGAYLGFGEGHRICIGMKAGLIMMKVACIEIISKYKLIATVETPRTIQFFSNTSFALRPETSIYVDVLKLK